MGNLVHLLWAPGQVGIDDKRPHWVQAISILAISSNTQMLLALLAYTIRDWRQLQIAVAIPVFLAILLYPITPESPR